MSEFHLMREMRGVISAFSQKGVNFLSATTVTGGALHREVLL